ncbi:MAG: GEVED domain-containing protein [Chloroflexota bacterium]
MTGSWVANSGYRITFEATAPAEGISIENTAELTPPAQSATQRFAGVQNSTTNFRTPALLNTITIVKNTVGGDATFDFSSNDASLDAISLTTSGNTATSTLARPTGTYTISEDLVAGWALTAITVTESLTQDSSSLLANRLVTLTLSTDEAITVTFTNQQLFDFSDNPDTYGTTDANSGAHHVISGPYLGATVDGEFDGFPSTGADGDDDDGTPDDEDGVSFTTTLAVTSTTYSVEVDIVNPLVGTSFSATDDLSSGDYSGGIGWQGDWVEAGDGNSSNPLWETGQVRVNSGALRISNTGRSVTRAFDFSGATSGSVSFDYRTRGTVTPTDHPLLVQVSTDGTNFSTVSTVITGTGTNQSVIVPLNDTHFNSSGNTFVRFENGGATNVGGANGYFVDNVTVTGETAPTAVTVVGWIDFDRSGTFEQTEAAIINNALTGTQQNLVWNSIPGTIQGGDTYARFRISSEPNLTTSFATGQASDGEVEDYPLTIDALPEPPSLALEKSLVSPASGVAMVGDTLTFQLQITNTGSVAVTELNLVDRYDPTILQYTTASVTPDSQTAGTITWTGNFGAGTGSFLPNLPLAPVASFTVTVDMEVIAPTRP